MEEFLADLNGDYGEPLECDTCGDILDESNDSRRQDITCIYCEKDRDEKISNKHNPQSKGD